MNTTANYPGSARAWTFIGVLFIASIASVIDRSLMNIVVDPVKTEIGLSDIQISLLQGLAFGLFYASVGLLLGLTADRYSRRTLIFLGMLLWSCSTLAAAFTHTFATLFASRLLVGLGEAALGPATISLIADLFPPDRRGRPISVFLMGQSLAVGLSISVAGGLLAAAHRGAFEALPLFHDLSPWRVVFACCGLAGIPVLVLLLLMREPARRTARSTGTFGAQASECIGYMARNRSVFVPFYLGFACVFAAAYGAAGWTPTMLTRQFGASPTQLAQVLGPLSLVFAVVGPVVGGFFADHYARSPDYAKRMRTLSFVPLLGLPSALAVFSPSVYPAIFLVAALTAVSVMSGTLTFAVLQSMVPGNMRGISVALTGVVNTVFGATLGPLLIATFTEHLYGKPELVGYSIATVAVPALLLAAACFTFAKRALRKQQANGGEVAALLTRQAAAAAAAAAARSTSESMSKATPA